MLLLVKAGKALKAGKTYEGRKIHFEIIDLLEVKKKCYARSFSDGLIANTPVVWKFMHIFACRDR